MGPYRVLFLDLDDTMYPSTSGLWEAVGERINLYLLERLGLDPATVVEVRDRYLEKYGTTLNGLIAEHQIDPYDYLVFVHDVPLEQMLQPDPALAEMLGRLGQKRVIFTNSYLPHVERVLRRLGVEAGIDQVIDIVTLDFVNKPKEQAYQRALELSGEMEPAACVIVDDRSVNLGPAVAMGMRPVLVDERGRASDGLPKISRITQLVELLPELLA
ncbi:MAG TPA: pyrimidine 5'-nucleotidase [Anaerolineales bacterium]|nr:pyrimidine 5'-nucleotidase [Anaerolineales bacterium]